MVISHIVLNCYLFLFFFGFVVFSCCFCFFAFFFVFGFLVFDSKEIGKD